MRALWRGRVRTLVVAVSAACSLGGCKDEVVLTKPEPRVSVEAVEFSDYAPTVTLTGEIRPRVQQELSFRVTGRIVERTVDVGAHVAAGQVLARLDPAEQQTSLAAAQATVKSADAQVRQAQTAFERQQSLLADGFTTRRSYDEAQETLRVARGTLEGARAQLGVAQDQLSHTVLHAPASGVVTARHVETGQVAQAAQPIFTVARDGARDAVFNVQEALFTRQPPEDRQVSVALVADRTVASVGTVREVAPNVSATTGAVVVKVGLSEPPHAMALGAAVSGYARLRARPVALLPWSALASQGGAPAVWVVDPATRAVRLKAVTVAGYESTRVMVGGGLAQGDLVVTAGGQFLRTGQVVTLSQGSHR